MPEEGERYLGTVVKTTTFGAFVSLLPGKDGLLHISKLRALAGGKRVENVEDVVNVGEKVQVRDRRDRRARQAVADPGRGRRRPRHRPRRRQARRREAVGTAGPTQATRTLAPGDGGGGLVRRTVLPGGLRVVTEAVPTVRSVTRRRLGRGRLPRRGALARRAPRTTSSTCCSRAPGGATRWTSPPAIDAVGGEMNAFTPRSTPASTRGCSTRTCRWPSTCVRHGRPRR